jgi:hypothetical protein
MKYNLKRRKEQLIVWIVWHLLPKTIVYWATIRAGAYATTGQYSSTTVPEIKFVEVLERYGKLV